MVQQEQSSSAVQHGVAVSKNIMESVNRLWTPKSNTERPDFNEKSILIAVMGMTGAGKTTFINQITDLDMEIGRGLKPCKYIIST
jgi:ABC-type lipoprotein export system ATPase subunit